MKIRILSLFLLLSSMSVFSQGWERLYGDGLTNDQARDAIQLPDGDYLLLASKTGESASIIRTDTLGFEKWRRLLLPDIGASALFYLPTGNLIVFGGLSGPDFGVMEIDTAANVLWSKGHSFSFNGNIAAVSDGFVSAQIQEPENLMLWKVSMTGDSLWQDTIIIPGMYPGSDICTAPDGGFAVTGSVFGGIKIAKFDADGNHQWTSTESSPPTNITANTQITATSDGGYAIAADLNPSIAHNRLFKFDGTGALQWWGENVQLPPYEDAVNYITDIIETSDHGFVIAGWLDEDVSAGNGFLSALKFDSTGAPEFFHISQFEGRSHSIIETNDGGFHLVGWVYDDPASPFFNSYAAKLSYDGILYANFLQGSVGLDNDYDCLISPDDQLLEGWTVRAQGEYTYYDVTEADGTYFLGVDIGDYMLEIFPPNDLWAPCENPVDVNLPNIGDTLLTDFPIQAAIECPAMQVDIATPFLRRCFENTLYVEYCNKGTVTAEDATLEVMLDSLLEFVSSEITPSGQSGNTFTFPLGDVGVNECGEFKIVFFVNCDAEIGQALCMEAHVFPDSICGMPFNWSGASMEARAYCEGDSTVILELENVGSVPTSQALDYIVIEDQIIFLQGQQVFDPTEVEAFPQTANGATWRIMCEQEPNHPGFSFPTAFVEGCGSNPVGGFSIGFVNEHPMADGDGFIDIDCEEVVASFDPNDKTGYPKGYDGAHYILPNTEIEYRIRFQNTGTDTAFNIVIRDTLTQWLDPSSIRPGASSHPYEFDLSGNGIIAFTFPDILLPDSNVNEALSHGFVSFKISQGENVPLGSVIENSAAIYFDFNDPVITNQTWHTVQENFIIVNQVKPGSGGLLPKVKVYPNPFMEVAYFEIEGLENKMATLHIFNSTGQLVHQTGSSALPIELRSGELKAGVYFFEMWSEGSVLGNGKFIILK